MIPGHSGTIIYIHDLSDGDEIKVELELSYTIGDYYPAEASGPAEDCYPAEGGEIEITGAALVLRTGVDNQDVSMIPLPGFHKQIDKNANFYAKVVEAIRKRTGR